MKELSEEKAIDVVKRMVTDGQISQDVAEKYFPELKESGDEMVRKEIIATIHLYYGEPLEDEAKEMIAWLEKQGEHANFLNKIQIGDKVTRNKDGVLVNLSQLKRVAKPSDDIDTEKQGKNNMGISEATKQKLEGSLNEALEKETPESFNEFLDEQGEQKPWSEEDEAGLGDALWAVQQARTLAKDENDMGNLWYAEKWLNSLKGRLQPNQYWSKEDEKIYQSILDDTVQENQLDKKQIDWLRNIKFRSQWKPSDEQMATFWDAICNLSNDGYKWINDMKSLFQDLKKLKAQKGE